MPWNSAAQGGGGPVEDSGGLVEGGRRSTHEKARMLSIRASWWREREGSVAVLPPIPSVVHAIHEGRGVLPLRGGARAGLCRTAAPDRGDGQHHSAEHGRESDHPDDDAPDVPEDDADDESADAGEQEEGP